MGRISRREADEISARVTAALEAGKANAPIVAQANRAELREAFSQLGAHHILKLARTLGVQPPKDIDARERFNYADAVKKELGI